MATKKITDLTQLTDLDATDSFVVNDSGAGADKRVEFSDLQSEVLNGTSIGTSTAITELQVDNLNLNGNTISSTDTNGNVTIDPNGTGSTVLVGDLLVDDKIIHSGDTNTVIRFPSADTVAVETAGSERLRIDSSGRILAGLTSTSDIARMVLQGNANLATDWCRVVFSRGDNTPTGTQYIGGLSFTDSDLIGGASIIARKNGSGTWSGASKPTDIEFFTTPDGSSTLQSRMLIDSSGKVVLSDASPSIVTNTTDGSDNKTLQLNGGGSASVLRGGNIVLAGNEATGTGSINIVAGNASGAEIKLFTTANSYSSEIVKIADSSPGYMRFASGTGGIQFNGDTAAANELDDYEEGTWTTVYAPDGGSGSFTTMTMDILSAKYTKIGNAVFISCAIRTDEVSVGTATGALFINGLPFTAGSDSFVGLGLGYSQEFATNNPTMVRIDGGESRIRISARSLITDTAINITVGDLTTGVASNKNLIVCTGVYYI